MTDQFKKEAWRGRYFLNADSFAAVRRRTGFSLREVARETGVDHCCISRFEHRKPIEAVAYIALMHWAILHNPNITY